MSVAKQIIYFKDPGPKNTDTVLDCVLRRVKEGDVKTVVVASTSGETGVKFAKALKGLCNVIVVSHEEMKQEHKEEILRLGGKPLDKTHLPLHARGMDAVRNSFYTLGQGFKVCVEIILIASDLGELNPGEDVIAAAGTGRGSDTAIVARACKTSDMFSGDKSKRLEIREILAMPLRKMWW
ncbi:MAG: pyruvate kinase alpha/beta domain-containing protein [Candidatus Bathyarchaeia archaeon]